MSFHVPNQYRIKTGVMRSDDSNGNNGAFFIPNRAVCAGKSEPPFKVIASDGGLPGQMSWEHVSVSLPHRCPTWAEMCRIKSIFWDANDVVIQYHPAESEYVNNHNFCLHLWRPVGVELPVPDSLLVGIKEAA